MEEITRKREGELTEGDDENAVKRPRSLEIPEGTGEDMGEDILAWLAMDGETVGELMKLLEPSIETPNNSSDKTGSSIGGATFRVKFIDNPYSTPLIFQSSSSHITINGNEETCGSSFSDFDSSVMASIDMGGVVNVCGADYDSGKMVTAVADIEGFAAEGGGARGSNEAEASGWMVEECDGGSSGGEASVAGMDGYDGFDCDRDWDDDLLARFLGEDLFCDKT